MRETSPGSNLSPYPLWKIRLFGSLEIVRPDASIIKPGGKKIGELLAWMALQEGKLIRREDLAERCWPESDPQRQRGRLRQEILVLRALIGEDIASFLVITKEHLQLSSDVILQDTDQFELLLEEARKSEDPSARAGLLARAIDLYRDDLLPEYPDLFSLQRSDYMRRYETALHDLARVRRSLGNSTGALECLQRLIAHDPLLEEAHADLMRVYAELGLPSQVRRQFNELERVLSEELDSEPTEATRRLRDSLLEGLHHSVSLPPPAEEATEEARHDEEAVYISLQPLPAPLPPSAPARPHRRVYSWTMFLGALVAAGIFFTNRKPETISYSSRPLPTVQWGQEKWAYLDRLEAGELPNSEAFAVAFTEEGNLFATGQVETKGEDTDFLTVRLSSDGKLVWRKRFSSAGHDCDRARSIAQDGARGVYVAGESYLPGLPGIQTGWYATLVHYDVDGKERWFRHTPLRIEAKERTQVIPDGSGGAILAAEEESKPGQSILFFHYNAEGKLLRQWRYAASDGANVAFRRMCDDSNGHLFVCGKIVRQEGSRTEGSSDWITLCYDMDGTLRWEKFCDGPARGNDSPSSIACDRNGNIFVAGVFSTGRSDDGSAALCPAVVKYAPDGQAQWLRWYAPLQGDVDVYNLTVANDGSSVTLAGKALTPERCFGAFALAYSGNGILLQMHRNQLPANYRSSVARFAYLTEDNRLLMLEDISTLSAERYMEKTRMALNWSDINGRDQALYAYPRWNDDGGWAIPRACVLYRDTLFTCGRVPLSEHATTFTVVGYPSDLH